MGARLVTLDRTLIRCGDGHCFSVKADFGPSDTDEHAGVSKLQLFEDGVELGPAHANHRLIETEGRGRFSHWKGELLFSSSDNSSCIDNGRLYQIVRETPNADTFPVSSLSTGALLGIQRGTTSYRYRGIDCFKCPFDIALYQSLMWDVKPRTIIEFGTLKGRQRAVARRSDDELRHRRPCL